MPKFEAHINVTRVYRIIIEAPDEEIAESAAWSMDTLSLHREGRLEYVEIEHVEVEPGYEDDTAHVQVGGYVTPGTTIYLGDY